MKHTRTMIPILVDHDRKRIIGYLHLVDGITTHIRVRLLLPVTLQALRHVFGNCEIEVIESEIVSGTHYVREAAIRSFSLATVHMDAVVYEPLPLI